MTLEEIVPTVELVLRVSVLEAAEGYARLSLATVIKRGEEESVRALPGKALAPGVTVDIPLMAFLDRKGTL